MIPLLIIEACVVASIPLFALHRMFVTTIDVKYVHATLSFEFFALIVREEVASLREGKRMLFESPVARTKRHRETVLNGNDGHDRNGKRREECSSGGAEV